MAAGFVRQVLVSAAPGRLILQAPPGVVRWNLAGTSCAVRYTMIKKTVWGGIRGSGGGAGGATCPWAPHLSLGAGGEFYSRGVDFSVIGGKVLPARGVRVRVRLANGATTLFTPHDAMWLAIVQRCGAYNKTSIKTVELIGSRGVVIARKVIESGARKLKTPPC